MSVVPAYRCDVGGEYTSRDELVTVHVAGQAFDLCASCQTRPVSDLLRHVAEYRLAQVPPPADAEATP